MIIFTLAAVYSVACVIGTNKFHLYALRPAGRGVNKDTFGAYKKSKQNKKKISKKGKTLGPDQSSRNVAVGRPTVDQLESQNICTAAWGPDNH